MSFLRKILLILWRCWFYILAGVPVVILFPILAIALLFADGYKVVYWIARNIWAPIILFGMGFYVRKKYFHPPLGPQSHLYIANHTSYIDPFVMLRLWKRPSVFVGKMELVKIPIFGYLYKRAVIMVDRSDAKSRKAVYGLANKALAEGYGVVIFPERHYEEEQILLNDFKRGAFKLAVDHQLPIVPMVFYDCKRKFPWYTSYGYPGELRAYSYPSIPTTGLTENDIPELQKEAHAFIEQKLLEDPKQMGEKAVQKWLNISSRASKVA
ncbi:MAG: lysophospholipid acyltransferase family protein [Flavobacteriaceae bacterium]